jgi:hypothetical protein
MKVSFDFDNTLEKKNIQSIAEQHIKAGDEVFIITRRCPEDNAEPIAVADELGIPHDHMLFTCGEWKWQTIKDLGIELAYDDKLIEVILIERKTKAKAILVQ